MNARKAARGYLERDIALPKMNVAVRNFRQSRELRLKGPRLAWKRRDIHGGISYLPTSPDPATRVPFDYDVGSKSHGAVIPPLAIVDKT